MNTDKIRFTVSDYKSIRKNTLQGSFTIQVEPIGLLIKECLHNEKNGKEWLAFPARSYTGKDGKPVYSNVLDFSDRGTWDKFQEVMVPRVKALASTPGAHI